MSKRAYKTYTREFKVEAVRLAAESDGPVTQIARELGLRVNQIYKEARHEIDQWRKHYNNVRPHSSLGYLPPVEFAKRAA